MSRRLVSYVHVLGEDGFTPVAFGPDDDVPQWAASQMGDHCFTEDAADPELASDEKVETRPRRRAAGSN